MEDSDLHLVERLLAGDSRAFSTFFEAYFPRLYRFALTRLDHDPHLSEEMVQATLCRAVNKLDTFRGEAPLFSWLCTFCRHEISAHFRKLNRGGGEIALEEDTTEIRGALDTLARERTDDPESTFDRDEEQRLVHETLDRLPSRYGDVLEWKYIEGISVREIAERLGVGEKAAESTLTRAREAFRTAFTEAEEPASEQPEPAP